MSLNNTQDFHKKLDHLFNSSEFDFNFSTEQQVSDILCLILSLSKNYWHKGIQLFGQLIDLQESAIENEKIFPPIMGGLLYYYHQSAPSNKEGIDLLNRYGCQISTYHKHLYNKYDKEEIGLIDSSKNDSKLPLFDVFFHSLLIWSNQALIEIAILRKMEDVDIILWNELSIFSCQEQLWNPILSRFQSKMGDKKLTGSKRKTTGFLPLFGNIPTQEEAEEMLKSMQNLGYPMDETGATPTLPKNFRLPFSAGYLLHQGLLNYDMIEAADCLKEYLLNKKGQKTLTRMVVLSLLVG